ncbi:1939_t:CDS:1, partial [Paraglomus occultum]
RVVLQRRKLSYEANQKRSKTLPSHPISEAVPQKNQYKQTRLEQIMEKMMEKKLNEMLENKLLLLQKKIATQPYAQNAKCSNTQSTLALRDNEPAYNVISKTPNSA